MKKVFVKSSGKGDFKQFQLMLLNMDKTVSQIDGFFDTEQEAVNFAKKKSYTIIDYKESMKEGIMFTDQDLKRLKDEVLILDIKTFIDKVVNNLLDKYKRKQVSFHQFTDKDISNEVKSVFSSNFLDNDLREKLKPFRLSMAFEVLYILRDKYKMVQKHETLTEQLNKKYDIDFKDIFVNTIPDPLSEMKKAKTKK